MADEFQAYKIEMETYDIILPALEKLFKEIGDDVKFGPRCYGIFHNSVEIIVLEDLKQEGLSVLDRHCVLNLDQINRVLLWLAQFHTASAVFVAKNGPLSETFDRGMFSKKFIGKAWGTHVDNLFKTFITILQEWSGFESVGNKIHKKFGNAIYKHCCDAMERHPGDFNVLNHGDAWITNVLFSTDLKLQLIDFQFTSWGSPVQDLWFFISTSVGIHDRVQNFNRIINEYQTHLKNSLQKLKYTGNIPTEEDLHRELIKRGVLALGITTESFAAMSIDKGMQIDFELVARDDTEADEFRRKIFYNPRFINTTKQYLNFLNEKGIFD